MTWPIVATLSVCFVTAALAADSTTRPAYDEVEFQHSPYLAITNGVAIYIGTVTSKHDVDNSERFVEEGRLEFSVQETVRGKKTDGLTISYTVQTAPTRGPVFSDWPPVDNLIKQKSLLLIVVMPIANDATPQKADQIRACNVYVISGADDPMVAAYRRLLPIDSLHGNDLETSLADEAKSGTVVERQFAEEAAYKRLDPDAAVPIIELALKTGSNDKLYPRDLSVGIEYLIDLAFYPGNTPSQRLAARCVFARLASSDNEVVRGKAIKTLASIAKAGARPDELLPTPANRDSLMRAASAAAKDPNDEPLREDAVAVLSWLGQPATAPSTRP